jgi:hypothetical protein
MGDYRHYVSILKGKEGEFRALRELSPNTKAKITPMIDIPRIPWDYDKKKAKKSLDEHLSKKAVKISAAWNIDRQIFIDLYDVNLSDRTAKGIDPVTFMFTQLRNSNVLAIPCTGFDRNDEYNVAIASTIAKDKRGVCIRILREDMYLPAKLGAKLKEMLGKLSVSPREVDLILDLRELRADDLRDSLTLLTHTINLLPEIDTWRTLTVAASGFPQDLTCIKPPSNGNITVEKIPRTELSLWRSIITTVTGLARKPAFGDYGICHPDILEYDPKQINMGASIRYTISPSWLIFKGKSLRDHGYGQFHQLSRVLISRREYRGAAFSWGDKYIEGCAGRVDHPGNPTNWRAVGTSHHLALVSEQIANFSET